MRARMLGAYCGVVQNGIGEARVFLLIRPSWAEPNGSVDFMALLSIRKETAITGAGNSVVTQNIYGFAGNICLCVAYSLLLGRGDTSWRQ